MSLARKCDICDELYEHYGCDRNDKEIKLQPNHIVFKYEDIPYGNTGNGARKFYDCCPNCMYEMQLLMKSLKARADISRKIRDEELNGSDVVDTDSKGED